MGLVRPSTSPIVMVKKKDDSNMACVDFRRLHKTLNQRKQQKINSEVKYLSKIDLTKGYWQIPVTPEDVHKTTFMTPDGHYEFMRMPFGMVNSGATLVRGLWKILEGMPVVRSYIDDIVAYSNSWKDHLRMLKELFGKLRKARITAQATKCLLRATKSEVITPSRDNLEKERNTPHPTTKKHLRSF